MRTMDTSNAHLVQSAVYAPVGQHSTDTLVTARPGLGVARLSPVSFLVAGVVSPYEDAVYSMLTTLGVMCWDENRNFGSNHQNE